MTHNSEMPDEHITGLNRILDDANVIDEDIIGMESGDIVNRIELTEKYNKVKHEYSDTFFSDLIFILTSIRLNEKTAREDWQSILKHKKIISEKLGRNVGIRVATLDFYTNINKRVLSPKIVDMEEYTKTVKESITDHLTFCYNRRYFDYIIKHYFLMAKESDQPLSLCMLDIDFFKIYNDSNGHIAGDFVLIEISRILNAVTKKSDIVSRYGGEEFAVVMPLTGADRALETAENIRKSIEDFRFAKEQILPGKRLTVSIGVVVLTDVISDYMILINRADQALYKAKQNGKNRVVLSGE
jgi:diguanylate cyclase (GGDEF)-like protein